MSKLIQGKIDVTKIVKAKLFTGQKGTYLDLNIWINDQPDQYGNICSIEQKTAKGEAKIYLGNGKEYQQKPAQPEEPTRAMNPNNPDLTNDDGNLPF